MKENGGRVVVLSKTLIARIGIFMLLAAIPMAYSSGCSDKDDTAVSSASGSSRSENETAAGTSEEVINTAEAETTNQTEGGWTIDEILDMTYLCDNQLSQQLNVESMDDEFKLDMDNVLYSKNKGTTDLYYNDKYLGLYTFTLKDGQEDVPDQISSISIVGHKSDMPECITINGISIGDPIEKLYDNLGEPDYTSVFEAEISPFKTVRYFDTNSRENGSITFTIDAETDMVKSIMIIRQ